VKMSGLFNEPDQRDVMAKKDYGTVMNLAAASRLNPSS
jgi:hypothetical protein